MSDIRKWFVKQHDKGNGNGAKLGATLKPASGKASTTSSGLPDQSGSEENGSRRKTSKYFNKDSEKSKPEIKGGEISAKRKTEKGSQDSRDNIKLSPPKKVHKVEDILSLLVPKRNQVTLHLPKS